MEIIRKEEVVKLESGVQDSYQLIWSENSSSENVTITKVVLKTNKTSILHKHDGSE